MARVRLTATWQLVIFRAEPVYCRCTPTEWRSPLEKPLSSMIHAHTDATQVISASACRAVERAIAPAGVGHEVLDPLVGGVRLGRIGQVPRCDTLHALAWIRTEVTYTAMRAMAQGLRMLSLRIHRSLSAMSC